MKTHSCNDAIVFLKNSNCRPEKCKNTQIDVNFKLQNVWALKMPWAKSILK
jgi:hypothetical protein